MNKLLSKMIFFLSLPTIGAYSQLPPQTVINPSLLFIEKGLTAFTKKPVANTLKLGSAAVGIGVVWYTFPFVKTAIHLFKTLPFETLPFIKDLFKGIPEYIRGYYAKHTLNAYVKQAEIEVPLESFNKRLFETLNPV